MPKPKHVLVIRLSAMGDVAIAIPVLSAFSRQYPDVKITLLTKGFFKPLFQNISNLEVFDADVKGNYKGLQGLFKLSRQLRKLDIDVVADFHNVLRSKILKCFLFNVPSKTIDKGRKEKKALVSGKIFEPLKPTYLRYAEVIESLGFSLDLSNPEFPPKRKLNDASLNLIGKDHLKWIGIAPFAAHEGKMYPLDLMKQVIVELSSNYKILLFGGGQEEISQLKNLELNSHIINVAGKLTFDEELAVISNLDLMISMDSGNGHLAAALGTKVLTIWGVTHPYAGFTPFNQPLDYSLIPEKEKFPEIPTSVYGNKYPPEYEKVSGSISPETIVQKVKSMI